MKKTILLFITLLLIALSCGNNPAESDSIYFRISGRNMQLWQTELGDSLTVPSDETGVSISDIDTRHHNDRSEVRVNINHRDIMAHNLNYYAKTDAKALNITHNAAFMFSLKTKPLSNDPDNNGDAVYGGLYVWDGSTGKTEYGVAFCWIVNPWRPDYGRLSTWTGSSWQYRTSVTPDTLDHTVEMTLDRISGAGSLRFDQHYYKDAFSATVYDDSSTGITARLEFSATNANPAGSDSKPAFSVIIKNWKWEWML